jgi:hypothetical protein
MHGACRLRSAHCRADEVAAHVDQHGFARLDVAQHFEAKRVDRHAFRGDHVFHALGSLVAADHQRANAA